MIKYIETLGTICGVIGAYLVASKMGNYGYPFFMVSSIALTISAIKQRQGNYIALQGTFLIANIIGLFNY